MPEQTATNPQTGERVVLRGGQWVPMAGGQTAPVTPQDAPSPLQQQQPIYSGVDPREQRAQRDQAMQERGEVRAIEAQAMSREGLALRQSEAALKQGERAAGYNATEGERKASAFLTRALGSYRDFENADVDEPSYLGQKAYDVAPDASNYFRSDARQSAYAAQDEFIAASLRQDSGAAIPPEELERQRRIYFPMPGDSDRVIAQKRGARQRAIRGLQRSSGRLMEQTMAEWDQISEGYNPLATDQSDGAEQNDQSSPSGSAAAGNPPSGGGSAIDPEGGEAIDPTTGQIFSGRGGRGQFGMDQVEGSFDRNQLLKDLYGFDASQERQIVAFFQANSNRPQFTEEAALQWFEEKGIPTDKLGDIGTLVQGAREGREFSGVPTQEYEERYNQLLDEYAEREFAGDPEGQGETAANMAMQGALLGFSDEIGGVGAGVEAVAGGGDFTDAYRLERDAVRRTHDRGREANPKTALAAEIAGGIGTGVGIARSPIATGRGAMTIGRAARIGASEGAIAGAGYGEGLEGTLGGAALGGLAGGAIGAGAQRAGEAISGALQARSARKAAAKNVDNAQDITQAAERQGVPVRRADIDPSVRGLRAQALQGDNASVIKDADAQDLAAIEGSLLDNLSGTGLADRFRTGDAVQTGLIRSREQARSAASREYSRAHSLAGDVHVRPENALRVLDEHIAELQQLGPKQHSASIKHLQKVKSDLARGRGLDVATLRGQRTGLRDAVKAANLDKTDIERRLISVIDAAGEDIETGLRGNADALEAFQRADGMWRDQASFGKQVIRKLMGNDPTNPIGAEATADRLTSFIGGDFGRARQVISQLNEVERQEIGGFIADSLGRNRRGDFSIATFLTNTSDARGSMIDSRTQALVFGERGMRAIRDLRTISAAKEAAQSATNRSNTGGVVQASARNLKTVMLAGIGLAEGGVTGGLAVPLAGKMVAKWGERRAARMLTNPDFTKWLKNIPETSEPAAINRYFETLRGVAARTPGMMADVDALERALISAVNDNGASRLAAEEQSAQE